MQAALATTNTLTTIATILTVAARPFLVENVEDARSQDEKHDHHRALSEGAAVEVTC